MTIGVLADGHGRTAMASVDAVRGARLAAELVNRAYPQVPVPLAAGTGLSGLAGARITVVAADTRGAADRAPDAASELVGPAAAKALVIADTAEAAAAAGSQAQRLRVPILDAASTADYLTELGLDWYFRTVPTDRMLADVVFALLRHQLRGASPPRLALLSDGATQTAPTAAVVRDLATRAGYPVAVDLAGPAGGSSSGPADLAPPPAAADARARQVSDGACDVILALAGTATGASEATQVAARLPAPLPLIGLGPGFATLAQAPPPLTTVLRTVGWSAELAQRSPAGRAVTGLYQRLFGVPMTEAAASTFTATMVLATAIDAAGSAEPAAVRAALRQLTLSATEMIMPWNGVRFDADGQNQLAAGVVEGLAGGGFRVVYPRELATAAMTWTEREVPGR